MIELNHLLSGVKAVAAHETSRSKSHRQGGTSWLVPRTEARTLYALGVLL
mgnify:CR=1 FL=1